MFDEFDGDPDTNDVSDGGYVSGEELADAIIEDTVHCKTCGVSMLCGDSECFIAGDHSYCPDHIQDAIEDRERVLQAAIVLLWRCYKAGHRDGWESSEANTEVFDAVNNFMADELGPRWGEKMEWMDGQIQ